MRRISVALFMLLSSPPSFAWGPMGHSIVGQVADRRLTSAARKECARLLGGQSLAQVSTWADAVRDARPETYNWHFVDIPKNEKKYDAVRDCKPDAAKGDCVVNELERAKKTLADTTQQDTDRAEALKYLVHFIGDAHQPLHCAYNHDRGGNSVHVRILGKSSNLHRVWDSGILDGIGVKEATFVRRARSWLTGQNVTKLVSGTTVDWVEESHKQAQSHAYGDLPADKQLTAAYVTKERPVVERQLATAGARLAKVLNEALDTEHAAAETQRYAFTAER